LRLIGIAFVFILALVAWATLGGVTSSRAGQQQWALEGSVADLWGSPQVQKAPSFQLRWEVTEYDLKDVYDAKGRKTTIQVPRAVPKSLALSPSSTRVRADLHLDERRKGLVWFPLYDVDFEGTWTLTNPTAEDRWLAITFPFPDERGLYDGFRFVVDGEDVAARLRPEAGVVATTVALPPGATVSFAAAYRSRGMSTWTYAPTEGVGQVEDFQLAMTTDFAAIDYPAMAMSPTTRSDEGQGWKLDWVFDRLVTGYTIGMVMPTRVQPGELASELSFSAPISLGLFFLWIYVLGLLKGIEIHPVNYLFIAAAFFSFNLLFAYTADHLEVERAFALASAVSVLLVASYLRLVVGARFALLEAGIAQVLYQVGFGTAHFYEGYTGLTITVLGILTLFALMQLTGRIEWGELLRGRSAPPAVPAPTPAPAG